jgi:hypothetical protein
VKMAKGKHRLGGLKKGHTFSPEMVQRRLARTDFDKIIQRLESTATAGEGVMTTAQLQAAALLLDRVAPRLSATELSGEVARPTVIRAPETVADSRTWLDKHAPERVEPETMPGKPN